MLQEFNHARHDGQDYDRKNDEGKIALHHGYIPEEITGICKSPYPQDAAYYIVADEFSVCHTPDPGDEGGEGPYYRDKTGNDDGLTTVFFVKVVCPVQVFPVEKTHIPVMKNLRPHHFPDPVIDRIAQYGSHREQYEKPEHLEIAARGKGPRGKKKGIAGKERGNDKAGFTENDDKEYEVCPYPVASDQFAQMHIYMNDKIKDQFYKFHRRLFLPASVSREKFPVYYTFELQQVNEMVFLVMYHFLCQE